MARVTFLFPVFIFGMSAISTWKDFFRILLQRRTTNIKIRFSIQIFTATKFVSKNYLLREKQLFTFFLLFTRYTLRMLKTIFFLATFIETNGLGNQGLRTIFYVYDYITWPESIIYESGINATDTTEIRKGRLLLKEEGKQFFFMWLQIFFFVTFFFFVSYVSSKTFTFRKQLLPTFFLQKVV